MNFLPLEIEQYASEHSSPESEVLKELNRETHAKILRPRMLSGHMQGKLLEMISCMQKPKKIIEIGTYTGYSAVCLAAGLQKGGEIHTIDHNPELEDFARSFFEKAGISQSVHYHIGEAMDILPTLEGPFDLAFIDADKDNYINYYEILLEQMPKGAIILADNVLWSGKVVKIANEDDIDTQSLQQFNDHIQNDPRVENLLLSFRDGLSIIRVL